MKRRVFYGWIVVFAGMGVMATAIGIVNNCFGLLIVPVCEELHFSRQEMAFNQTLLNLAAMLVAGFWGVIVSHVNLKRSMSVCAVIMCGLYALFSTAHSLAGFYSIVILVGLAQGMLNVVPFSVIVNNWFEEKKGLALGLTYMGTGLGGMLFNIIGGQLIARFDWRKTVLVFSVILSVVILPLVFFVIKTDPSDMGLQKLGEKTEAERQKKEAPPGSLKPLLKKKEFYIIALDIMAAGLAINGFCATTTAYYTDEFSSGIWGANMTSALMGSLAVGKLLLGRLYDRLGTLRATLVSRGLVIVSLLFIMQGDSLFFIAAYLICAGIAGASNSVSVPFLARDSFDTGGCTSILGIYSAMQSFGSLLSPILCGWVRDHMGSYAPSYLFLAILVLAMLVPSSWILKTADRKNREK